MAKITYSDKTFINENVGVADINKVKDTDMNEIKSVVNDNYDEFTSSGTYSTTEEIRVGTWIDGKPIYRKTYQHTGGAPNTTISENITINDDVERFVYYEVLATNASNPANSLKAQYYNDANDFFRFFTNNATTLSLRYNLAWAAIIYITIYYTKTTD